MSAKIECQILAPDLRAHGLTTTNNDEDLSVDRLTEDIAGIYSDFFGHSAERPPMVVIGHSLGYILSEINSWL